MVWSKLRWLWSSRRSSMDEQNTSDFGNWFQTSFWSHTWSNYDHQRQEISHWNAVGEERCQKGRSWSQVASYGAHVGGRPNKNGSANGTPTQGPEWRKNDTGGKSSNHAMDWKEKEVIFCLVSRVSCFWCCCFSGFVAFMKEWSISKKFGDETGVCEMYASHLQTYVDANLSARAPFAMLRTKQSCASDVPSDWLALRWFVSGYYTHDLWFVGRRHSDHYASMPTWEKTSGAFL